MRVRQGWATAAVIAAALVLPACEGDKDVTAPSVEPITISLRTLARASISCPPDLQITCLASVPVQLVVETTGAPVQVTRVTLSLRDTITGRPVSLGASELDGDQLRNEFGSNVARAGQPLGITQTLTFPVGRITSEINGAYTGYGKYVASVFVTGLRDGRPVESSAEAFLTDF